MHALSSSWPVAQEKREISDFLDAILATRPMQYCHHYLTKKGLMSADRAEFKRALYQMWFSFYRWAVLL